MYTFLFWMVHCGIWNRCIVRLFVCEIGLLAKPPSLSFSHSLSLYILYSVYIITFVIRLPCLHQTSINIPADRPYSSHDRCLLVVSSSYKYVIPAILHRTARYLWCRDRETFSTSLALCKGNRPVSGGFPSHRESCVELWFFLCC